ncbi:MAG: outer membrane beta-barrel protein [Verrucomicrobia bacterium]|nr:outer membrane beta-barrel protein [Verrucomicrobiota bacterium]
MNFTIKLTGIVFGVFTGFFCPLFADDPGHGDGKKSLESRLQELEQKLKDIGADDRGVKGDGIKLSGYVDTSYIVNLSDRSNSGPVAGSSLRNTGRTFDYQYDSFNLHAVKLVIEKDKDDGKFPAGFRADVMYGDDANFLNGNLVGAGLFNDSSVYIEQAYVNLGAPVGNGIDIKIGKMVTLMSYEVLESPANWQFSRSEAYRLGPFTQTGAQAGYKWNDFLASTVAVINGMDAAALTGGAGGGSNLNTDFSFVGRLDATGPKTSWGDFSAFAAGLYGNDDFTAPTSNDGAMHHWNIGGTWSKPFEIKPMTLGIDYFYRQDHVQTVGGAVNPASLDASAITGYGKWDWNSWLTTSGRFGYSVYHNAQATPAGAATGLGPLVVPAAGFNHSSSDYYNFTLTQAFNIWKDTLIRLEWRHDWTDTPDVGFGAASATAASRDDIRQEQDTIAVNVVYSF